MSTTRLIFNPLLKKGFQYVTVESNYSEALNFAALPSAAANAGRTYLVLQAQGNWYTVNRKDPGLYYSNGSSWSYLGELPSFVKTDEFRVQDYLDQTKQLAFDNSGITTANTRTLIVPDSSGNILLTQMISGEASSTTAGVFTLTNSAIIGKVLTGYTSGAGTVSATDTILQAIQKLNGNFTALTTAPEFSDSIFRIYDNSVITKKISFEVSGVTAATTRILTVQDKDITVAGINNETFTGTTNLATVIVSTSLTVANDQDTTTILGRAAIGSPTTDTAYFAHIDHLSNTNYALRQQANGVTTSLNTITGGNITLRVNNVTWVTLTASSFTVDNSLIVKAGTVSNPSILFTGSATSTGFFASSANDVNLSISGTAILRTVSTGVTVTGLLAASGAVTTNTSFQLLDTTYKIALDVSAANILRIGNGYTSLAITPSTFTFATSANIQTTTGSIILATVAGAQPITLRTIGDANTNTGVNITLNGSATNGNGTTRAVCTISGTYAPIGGTTGVVRGINVNMTINETAPAANTTTLIDLNPTLTSVRGTIYGFRSQLAASPTGGGVAWNIYADGTAANGFGGDIKLLTAGNGLYVKEGTNACMGVATLVAGTIIVNTTKVTANSRIYISVQSLGTVAVATAIAVTARTAGTSFTITSASITDTSVISWLIIEPS